MSVVFLTPPSGPNQPGAIENYYRLHARIYDGTRWSFLFGRAAILAEVAARARPARILEVGCGTGRNLVELGARFPGATLTGVDLSAPMLAVARRKTAALGARVELRQQCYNAPLGVAGGFDLVLFSYALSMFNPGFETAMQAAVADLAPGGRLAVVDFHATRFRWFERWMGVNHVRMNGQLQPLLQTSLTPEVNRVNAAYGGVWQYLTFVGRKK
jgi:S-adenosylmethionine-diacylgycerolhomoserine-N-methlytransferase